MENETILVAEDSPTEMRIVVSALEARGYRVVTAVDGEDAFAKATSLRPRLAVLDIVMPKMNGFQVLRKLKSSDDTKNIKVLLLSSKSSESDRFWGLKQGADEYITKPFESDALAAAVMRLL
ncbi:MAG: response regulator [Pyrinomonadaceae bacterium]|nr:response regulator [Pyrinomonadaceae bacterium]